MKDEYVSKKLKALGKVIKEVRTAQKLTQANLAQLAEIDSSNLQKIESGKNTTVDTLVRICDALKLEDYLLFDYAWDKRKRLEFAKRLESIEEREKCAAANSSHCENAQARHEEEKSFSHTRSCGGGRRCYNQIKVKNLKSNLCYKKW